MKLKSVFESHKWGNRDLGMRRHDRRTKEPHADDFEGLMAKSEYHGRRGEKDKAEDYANRSREARARMSKAVREKIREDVLSEGDYEGFKRSLKQNKMYGDDIHDRDGKMVGVHVDHDFAPTKRHQKLVMKLAKDHGLPHVSVTDKGAYFSHEKK